MVDIAKHLKITAGSCSTGVKSLLKKWLIIEDDNKFIKLTKNWTRIIEEILSNRETLFNFFKNVLWVSQDKALIDACKIEHLIWTEVIAKMKSYKK